jgi:drug/metabolite transporter (DMT)-like permease
VIGSRRLLPYAAVALASCSWGTWPLVLRHVGSMGTGIGARAQSAVAMLVMTVTTGVFALFDRNPRRATWRQRASVGWLGVSDAMNVLLLFAAYKLTISVAVLTHYLAPVLVAIAAPLVLREAMTLRAALAVAISFVGLAVMLAPWGAGGGTATWVSAALGAGSAVFYASNVIVNKFVVETYSTSETMFWHGVVATPLLVALVPGQEWLAADARATIFLAVATVGPGALGGLLFVWGLRRMRSAHASTLTLLEPVVAMGLGAAWMGEPFGARLVAGGALILAGATLVMVRG